MKDLFEDIGRLTGLPLEILQNGYKFINFAGKALYVEGFTSIILLESEQIILKLKKGRLKVLGSTLSIKDLNFGQLMIKGNLSLVEVL